MSNTVPKGLTPWKPGQSGNPDGSGRARRALFHAIEKTEIPKVLTLLAQLYEQALGGDVAAARLWLDQVRGPVKARTDDEIEHAVEQRILELVSQARARNITANAGTYHQAAVGEPDSVGGEADRESELAPAGGADR